MNRKAIIVSIALSVAVGTFAGASVGVVRASTRGCPVESARRVDPVSAVADGDGLAAAVGRSIVMVGGDGRRQAFLAPSPPGTVVRHVAASAGHGTAYVEDRRGPDVVVIVDGSGVTRLPQVAEATQPAWSADGRLVWSVGSGLRLWSGSGRSTESIPAPADAIGIFSPVFTGPEEITAVVSERVPGTRPEDEALNDLFSYDLATGAWTRRTSFEAHGDRWSAIRTPVVGADGDLQFVRIVGDAAATVRPASSLWTVGPGRSPATKIRDLTSEMYLAGVVGGQRVWSGVDLAVRAGEFVAVLGPNGVGKSTLIKAVLGVIPLTAGDLRV
ncbi:MAG: ATP-binding cassette domain-containing protein, partial [Actinomycetota bacterium]